MSIGEKTYHEDLPKVTQDEILELLKTKNYIAARKRLLLLDDVETAELITEIENVLGIDIAIVLFRMLRKDQAAEVFSRLSPEDQTGIITRIADHEIKTIINEMDFDDMIDVLEELPANIVDRILEKSSPAERQLINTFLNYPASSAGSLMTPSYVTLQQGWTVAQALKHIKAVGMDSETVYTCYVKDKGRRLLGVVSLRDLVTKEPDEPISDFMVEDVVFVNVLDDREEVSEVFKRYEYFAIPVVDNEKRLVGIITFDDILKAIEEETTEDIERMAGVIGTDDKGYFETSILRQVRNRLPWLIILMASAMLTGLVIAHFELQLALIPSLIIYLPLLMGTGGNAGSQSATLIIRGLALGEVAPKNVLKVLWRELRIALLSALVLSALNMAKILLLDGQPLEIAITVCSAQIIVVVIAKSLGGMLPLLAKKVGIDPALMAGPLIASLVDTFTCFVYLSLSIVILSLF
ncbi:MAG: magnesium transporter [Coriobacteriia bacterium]|nr:magnesium transporter [Coriobacteriia bacterium]